MTATEPLTEMRERIRAEVLRDSRLLCLDLRSLNFSRRETSSVAEVAQSAGVAGAHKTASDGRAGEFTQGASEASGAHNPVEVGATPAPATICRYCGGNHHTGNCAYATDHE